MAMVIIHQINAGKVPEAFASEVFPNDGTERIASEAHVEVVRKLRDDTTMRGLEYMEPSNTYHGTLALCS